MNGKKSTLCASFCFGQNESKIKKSDTGLCQGGGSIWISFNQSEEHREGHEDTEN